jgi:hypothetical protein
MTKIFTEQMLTYSHSDRAFINTTDLVKLVEFTARCAQAQTHKFFKSVASQHF